jgi:hypothetical protein
MIDLMKIARTEADGGDLFGALEALFQPTDVRPEGHPEAVIWKGGNHNGKANPVAHSLTDAYALLGTIAAADVLGMPFYGVPMWSQYRHDKQLAPLSWFGNMPVTWRRLCQRRQGRSGCCYGQVRQRAAAHPGRRFL